MFLGLFDDAFFLQSAQSRSCDIDADFFAINNQSAFLDVWLEDFAGLVLRKRNIMTVHLALAANFTNCHYFFSFTLLTTVSKAFGWLTASSARILRSIATPCCLRPAMSWE